MGIKPRTERLVTESRPSEIVRWLHENVGPTVSNDKIDDANTQDIMMYLGPNWLVRWMSHRSKYIFDVTFDNPKDAIFFTLRWK
jgi:hypothetical protein